MKNRTMEQIFRDDDIDEEFIRWPQQDQEMAGLNDLNDDYKNPPKKEYPNLNFIDITKYGRWIDIWWEGC